MSSFHLVNQPPADTDRIHELHCWVAITRDGGEGILSADFDTALGKRHMPLISSQREIVERMKDRAITAQTLAAQAGQFIEIELRTYLLKRAPEPGQEAVPENMLLAAGFIQGLAESNNRTLDDDDKKILRAASSALLTTANKLLKK